MNQTTMEGVVVYPPQEQQFQQGIPLPGPYPHLQTAQYPTPHEECRPPDIGYQPSCASEYPQEYFIGNGPPPPYYSLQQPPIQTATSTNLVVIQQQPTTAALVTTIHSTGDHYLTLGIILTIVCCLCGTWYSLFCSVPAILFSLMAREAEERGDEASMMTNHRLALGCNVGALVCWIAVLVIIILAAVINGAFSTVR